MYLPVHLSACIPVHLSVFYLPVSQRELYGEGGAPSGGVGGWRGPAEDASCPSSPSSFHTPAPIAPTSLRVLVVPTDQEKQKLKREKKKRRRHSRKPPGPEYQASLGPFGGPQEWLGRRDDLAPVQLDVPPHVLAALEEKAARKAEQKARRVAVRERGKEARIAAKLYELGQGQGLGGAEGSETQSQSPLEPPPRPRLKYLPKLQQPEGKRKGHSFGIQSLRVACVND